MNDEDQLLLIFRSLYFEIKCNNNKKDPFKISTKNLLCFQSMRNNTNRITELSCWGKGIIGVVMSFFFVGTCLHYSFGLATVHRSIN